MMKSNKNYLNKLIFKRSFKNIFSFTFILCLTSETAYPTVTANYNSKIVSSSSGVQPVAEIGSDMVDPFTGDFGYSVPLLNIPGPNGENVDLTASYAAGIAMDQRSGLLGLGWGLNVGEISRQIVGAPDDHAGQPMINTSGPMNAGPINTSNNPVYENNFKFGPFYYNKLSAFCPYTNSFVGTQTNKFSSDNLVIEGAINNDPLYLPHTYEANRPSVSTFFNPYFTKPTAPYAMPAYDNYMVSGPGISGKIHPYIFSTPVGTTYSHPMLYSGTPQPTSIIQNRKTQFYFENSSLNSRDPLPDNLTDNRIASSTYVKYYTNSEINTSTNLFNGNTSKPYTGFLDYQIPQTGTRRPTTKYDANGIGGIEVTNADGLTYHYSLPVMVNGSVDKAFYNNTFNLTYKSGYAISWKLTAITGTDYKDMNNNKMADEGDIGYWVAYKYGLWHDTFFDANVLYNLKGQTTNKGESYYLDRLNFTLSSNLNQSSTEQYYLDYIRTSTHTAYFIKGIKLDDHSAEFALTWSKVNPSLKLNKIILLRNKDKGLIENSAAWTTTGLNSKFFNTLLVSPKDNSLIHNNKYISNKTNIDNASLKSIEFVQDYSLCKKYFSNINNSFGTVTPYGTSNSTIYASGTNWANAVNNLAKINFNSQTLYSTVNISNFSTTDANNSGKLTLNQIKSYEDGGVTVFSPYSFDYRKSSLIKNPDYNPLKQDIWGFYKSDRNETSVTNSGYPTLLSALNVDAWSLSKITLPQGGTIEVEYESDNYAREGFDDMYPVNVPILSNTNYQYMKGPHLLFPIKSITCNNPPSDPYCSLAPSLEQYEYDDKAHVDSCVKAQFGTTWSAWSPYVSTLCIVPTLVSCTKMGLNSGPPTWIPGTYCQDFPDSWIYGDNTLGSFYYKKWPDIVTQCSQSNYLAFAGYDKTKAYGYNFIGAKNLYGGGIRVKKITVTETSENLSYEQKFEYTDGYCPVVPKKCMLGASTQNTFFSLWQGNYNLLPYLNLTNVGYTEVKVTNTNKFSQNNGFTKYTFTNKNLPINPLQIIPTITVQNTNDPCSNSPSLNPPFSSSGTTGNSHVDNRPKKYHYNLFATLSDQFNEERGKLNKIQKYDNSSTPNEIYKKTFTYDSYYIGEKYSHNLSLDYHKQVTKYVTLTFNTPPVSSGVNCNDMEFYNHYFAYKNYGMYLTKTEETVDGITTTNNIIYDSNTALATQEIKSSPNIGKIRTLTEYAYQISGIGADSLRSKVGNEANLNMLNVPYKVSTFKSGVVNQNVPAEYLVSQNKNEKFGNITQIREFSNASTTYNPNGTYWTNTSSSYINNSRIAFESRSGLINTTNTSSNASSFRLQGRPTLFSINGKVLESYGVNDRYSAVRLGYNNLYPLTSISNARYGSFGFTSFEDTITVAPNVLHFGGEFTKGTMRYIAQPTIKPHTGSYMCKVNPSTVGPSITCRLFDPDKIYEAKVWVHKSSPANARLAINVTGLSTTNSAINTTASVYRNDANNITVGDWVLMKVQLHVPSNLSYTGASYLVPPDLTVFVENVAGSGFAYFDDLMFSPIDIPISGNVYDQRTSRLTAVLDGENFATYMNYDAAGRPTSVYKETKAHGVKKVSETEYNSCQSMQTLFQSNALQSSSSN